MILNSLTEKTAADFFNGGFYLCQYAFSKQTQLFATTFRWLNKF